jgi:peptide/nickel transport system substrate-binding protein
MENRIFIRQKKYFFSVQKEFGDLNKANTVVYGSNPQDFNWHIYTEGFSGNTEFMKYNPIIIADRYAPWYGNMPGGQNPSFWKYQNSGSNYSASNFF